MISLKEIRHNLPSWISLLGTTVVVGLSAYLSPFPTYNKESLILLWVIMGFLAIASGSGRTAVISLPIFILSLIFLGRITPVNSPNWVLVWILPSLLASIFQLIFVHSLIFRDHTRILKRSLVDRAEKVSATLDKLSQKIPTKIPKREGLPTTSVRSLQRFLGLTVPEEDREIADRERLKNFIEESKKTDPDLMEHLKLTTKGLSLKSQFFSVSPVTHYLLIGTAMIFLFLTPILGQHLIPQLILESIDIFQPEIIILVFLLYLSLILLVIGALTLRK